MGKPWPFFLTLRNSLLASWYSRVIVLGAGPANERMPAKSPKATSKDRATYKATLRFSSAGGTARGPWAPKAIQYAARRKKSQLAISSNRLFVNGQIKEQGDPLLLQGHIMDELFPYFNSPEATQTAKKTLSEIWRWLKWNAKSTTYRPSFPGG